MDNGMIRKEFLLEIGVEEVPAGVIGPILESLREMMVVKLEVLGLEYGAVRTAATPRRLAICVEELVARQPDRREDFLGPSAKAAFADNKPTKAAIGFAASKGASVDDLEIVTTAKGEYVRLVMEKKGESTDTLLAAMIPELILGLPFPKSMHWGSERITFVRPIQWLLALYGGKVIPFSIGSVVSGSTTRGHRFMAPAPIFVHNYEEYLQGLRQAHVLADITERRRAVSEEINRVVAKAAGGSGGHILQDEELLDTVTNLVECPHGVCGVFDQKFLTLPDSVLITAMREHQKYFSVVDSDGNLLANFVAVNNTRIKDEAMAAAGHQRVLRARLEDALFFFKDDQRRPLAARVEDLAGLIFQTGLGTMQEKTERLVHLATYLADKLGPEFVAVTRRSALLAKADLMTAMVGEFPSLQGVMGRDYALLDGEDEEVATAIFEHYLPVRAGGRLPSTVPGALTGLADRLDTIAGCFGIGQVPTGTADPFGLRRLALGLLHIIEDRGFSLSLPEFVGEAVALYGDKLTENPQKTKRDILEFIRGRFVNDLIARGIPRAAVEAVTSVSFDDVLDCRARIVALAAIKDQPTFTILAAAFKRVMNIIKENRGETINPFLLQEAAEKNLYDTFMAVQSEARPLLLQKEYARALEVILRMKESVDTFFDEVMVMVDEQQLRENRLNLLKGIAQLFLQVGDFSKMHG